MLHTSPKPTFGESARFHLSDHRLFAWHNFRFPDIQTSVGCAVQCDSSLRIDHGGRVLWEWTVTQKSSVTSCFATIALAWFA
jgi:hypothetical protein